MLVKMDKFIFLVEFVILDVDDKVEVPLILGIKFFATSQAQIDVKDSRMVLRMGEEEITFKLRDSMWHSIDFDNTCYYVNVVDDFVSDYM